MANQPFYKQKVFMPIIIGVISFIVAVVIGWIIYKAKYPDGSFF